MGAVKDAGAVHVLYGSGSGLTAAGDQFWHQGQAAVIGNAEAGDLFGGSLASGDYDNDGMDDLAIGVNAEGVGSIADAGAVNVFYSSGSGLTAAGDQLWYQGMAAVIGKAEPGDVFGGSLEKH